MMGLILFAALSWYEEKLEGWYYFQEEPAAELMPSEADELLEYEKQHLKELLSLALIEPTPENVRHFVDAQEKWARQSAFFADTWGDLSTAPVANTHFLLFCFRGQDPDSIAAAATVQRFAHAHHLVLKGISLDGIGMEGISWEKDQGMAENLGVKKTPSLYVVDPQTEECWQASLEEMKCGHLSRIHA
jgi:hypothetical protein